MGTWSESLAHVPGDTSRTAALQKGTDASTRSTQGIKVQRARRSSREPTDFNRANERAVNCFGEYFMRSSIRVSRTGMRGKPRSRFGSLVLDVEPTAHNAHPCLA